MENGPREIVYLDELEASQDVSTVYLLPYASDYSFNPDSWIDSDWYEILEMERWVFDALKVTPEQRKKISINYSPQTPMKSLAYCEPILSETDDVVACEIHIGTSISTLFNPGEDKEELEELNYEADTQGDLVRHSEESLQYHTDTPKELLLAILLEEVHHAKTMIQAKRWEQVKVWRDRQIEIMEKSGIRRNDYYNIDILEIAAGRNVVYYMAEYARQQGDEQNAANYRNIFRKSLDVRVTPTGSYTQLLRDIAEIYFEVEEGSVIL
jgi:hypothetical protein